MSAEISNAAGGVAQARVSTERTAAALMDAEAARDRIKDRIAEKQAARAEIVATRKSGVDNARDGARLMTIAADIEGLAELLAEADADVTKAAAEADKARRVLVQAEADLAKASDAELLRRLVEYAAVLDAKLLRSIREIADTWKRLGRSPGRETWTPTTELADAIKRIDLTRDNRK